MKILDKRTIVISVIVALISAIIVILGQYYISCSELEATKNLLITYQHNEKVSNFTKLFVGKVIMSTEAVSFEDRIRLENAVRDISDDEISEQWKKFVDSETESSIQEEAKELLNLLVNKI